MHYSIISLFCWNYPACLPGGGHIIKGFSLSFTMDIVEIEAFSFLRQEISRQLIIVSRAQNRSPLAYSVINQVIDYFSVYTPVNNQCFHILVIRLALNVHLAQH